MKIRLVDIAHARSGDAVAVASYLGTSTVFDDAMARFGEAYADQNDRDYDALKEAAAILGFTERTAKRYWIHARAWLLLRIEESLADKSR